MTELAVDEDTSFKRDLSLVGSGIKLVSEDRSHDEGVREGRANRRRIYRAEASEYQKGPKSVSFVVRALSYHMPGNGGSARSSDR